MSSKDKNVKQIDEKARRRQTRQLTSRELDVTAAQLTSLTPSVQRAVANPALASPADVLAMQRAYGNRAVSSLVQTKLMVGPAGDSYEQEADRVAGQVMSMTTMPANPKRVQMQEDEELVQTKPLAASITPIVQMQEDDDEELVATEPLSECVQRYEDEEILQTKPLAPSITPVVQPQAEGSFEVGSELESRLVANNGGGSPLPEDVRTYMEPRFGADFSGVRVHTDGEATQMNRELNAQAFTHDRDIYMGEGKYDPSSHAGKRLLAHELTHVVQQGGARVEAEPHPTAGWSQRYPATEPGTALAEDHDIAEGATAIVQRQGDLGIVQRNDVTFPAYDDIVANATVVSETDDAWKETKDATTEDTRREQSFWIRWNSKTQAYSVTQKKVGPAVANKPPAGASVTPGAKPADAGDEYTVGMFHTHTPTTHWTAGYERKVGPSTVDKNFHNDASVKVPGVVYDYKEKADGKIPSGHPLNAAAKKWHCGPNRRT